jgi:hypothetical protein
MVSIAPDYLVFQGAASSFQIEGVPHRQGIANIFHEFFFNSSNLSIFSCFFLLFQEVTSRFD